MLVAHATFFSRYRYATKLDKTRSFNASNSEILSIPNKIPKNEFELKYLKLCMEREKYIFERNRGLEKDLQEEWWRRKILLLTIFIVGGFTYGMVNLGVGTDKAIKNIVSLLQKIANTWQQFAHTFQ